MSENLYKTISKCRICDGEDLVPLFSLGEQYVSDFPEFLCSVSYKHPPHDGCNGHPRVKVPIDIVMCRGCTLVQQKHTAPQDFMYTRHYWYRSGTTQTMRDALKDIAQAAERVVKLEPGDIVLDIGCFPEADVVTSGYLTKDISSVKVGDKVLDREGNFVRVLKKFEKTYTGELISLKLRGITSSLRMTPNHPVLIVRRVNGTFAKEKFASLVDDQDQNWIRADQILSGDYCLMASKIIRECSFTRFDISSLINCDSDQSFVYAWQTHKYGGIRRAHHQKPIYRWLTLDERFGRLLGYYVSEGSGERRGGAFSLAFNQKEIEYLFDVQTLLSDLLGLDSRVSKNSGRGVSVRCSSMIGKRFFQALVGKSAESKRLPEWVFSAPAIFRKGLVDGMIRGDGSFTAGYVKYDSVSKCLAVQLQYLLRDLGINSSLVPNKPAGYGAENGKTLWSVRIYSKQSLKVMSSIAQKVQSYILPDGPGNNKWPTNNNCTLVRVSSVDKEQFSGIVYNLETRTGSYVVDPIVVHNSNDGTLLRSYTSLGEKDIIRVGVEPAENLAEEGKRGVNILIKKFWEVEDFTGAIQRFLGESRKAKIITAIGMAYDLEEPNEFFEDISLALHPEGVFIAQLMCLKQTVEKRDVGNFVHEHLLFYSLRSLIHLLAKHKLTIFDVTENNVNGGSYRLFIRHARAGDYSLYSDVTNGVGIALRMEARRGFNSPDTYSSFFQEMERNREEVRKFIRDVVLSAGQRIYVLGASTKGNVLLQWWDLDSNLITAAVERSPEKVGKFTVGSGIPIISEEQFRNRQQGVQDYALILPYAFADEIMERERPYIGQNGKFIIPLPVMRVI